MYLSVLMICYFRASCTVLYPNLPVLCSDGYHVVYICSIAVNNRLAEELSVLSLEGLCVCYTNIRQGLT